MVYEKPLVDMGIHRSISRLQNLSLISILNMNKKLLRLIGIQIIILGFVLSIFEFLIDNSGFVVGSGLIILIASLFLRS